MKHNYTVMDVLVQVGLSLALSVLVAVAAKNFMAGVFIFVGVLMIFLMLVMLYFAEAMLYSVTRIFGPDAMPDPFVIGPMTMIQRYLERKYEEDDDGSRV